MPGHSLHKRCRKRSDGRDVYLMCMCASACVVRGCMVRGVAHGHGCWFRLPCRLAALGESRIACPESE
eukprot:scaffold4078_cov68-Phaeocystis_antarctica.AAC.24